MEEGECKHYQHIHWCALELLVNTRKHDIDFECTAAINDNVTSEPDSCEVRKTRVKSVSASIRGDHPRKHGIWLCGWWKSHLTLCDRALLFDSVTLCAVTPTLACHLSQNWRCGGVGWGGVVWKVLALAQITFGAAWKADAQVPPHTYWIRKLWWRRGPEIHI